MKFCRGYTASAYWYVILSTCSLSHHEVRIKSVCRTRHMTFNIVKSYENRKKISILTQTVLYFCFLFSANSQVIILIYNSRKISLSKNSYSPRLSLETPPSELNIKTASLFQNAVIRLLIILILQIAFDLCNEVFRSLCLNLHIFL